MPSRPLAALAAAALTAGLLATAATAPASAAAPPTLVKDPAAYVDPLIGSAAGGDTFPGAVVPFGMLSWSPENTRGDATRTAAPGGYHYDATRVRGFSLTHMSGTGCAGGAGDIPFFPYVGEVTSSPSADTKDQVYAADFSHSDETAEPGRYKVGLASGAGADLTATARTGSARFTYPADKTASLLIRTSSSEVGSTDADLTIDPAHRTVSGSVTSGNFCGYLDPEGRRSYYTLHFTATFDTPFTAQGTWQDGTLRPGTTSAEGGTGYGSDGRPVAGKGSGGYLQFAPGTRQVGVKVGISYVSDKGARANLAAENPPRRGFDQVRTAAYDAWRRQLSAIRVGGGADADRTTFYTALYHSLLHPNVISDTDGRYRGGDGEVHRVSRGHRAQYGTFSGWDVYRSQVQLLTLLEPDKGSDIAQSLLNLAQQNGGVWDRWLQGASGTHVMNGDPSPAALAGIRAFGGTRFDLDAALDSLVKAATVPTDKDLSPAGKPIMSVGQRPSLDKYLKLHYMPSVSNAWGGAAETLEMSGADFALSQLARAAGRKSTADTFARRAQWWQNTFNAAADPATGGYIANRKADGSWVTGFTPATGNGFVEGTSAQYTWMVQHNPAGLFAAMGGKDAAIKRLDAFFHDADGGWALTGAGGEKSELDNEPSINVPYLYAYAGQPYKTQETVRAAMRQLWTTDPDGIPGNDDLGEMSSWYVFSALGMYPQVPSRAELVLASPLFPRIEIERGGRDISIRAPQAAPDAPYVQSLKVNGRASDRPWLPESFVQHGGTLDYTLSDAPDRAWGASASDAPPSFREGEQPYQIGVGPTTGTLAPGESLTVKVAAVPVSEGDRPEVRFTTDAPDGITTSPASGTVGPDGAVEISLRAGKDTAEGFYDAKVTVTSEDTEVVQPITLTVAAPGTLLAAYNNVGATDDDGEHDEGDYDGGGWSYSRQALAAAGLEPGAMATVQGLDFTWPASPAGRPDNASATGQTIDLPASTALSFIGSAVNGNQKATAKVAYTDGTTDTTDLSFTDWTVGGGGGTVQYGNVTVAKTAYRNISGGDKDVVDAYIFATKAFQAPEGKTIKSITLPDNADLHVFAVARG